MFRSEQDGRHFADDIIKGIFLREQSCILIDILLKFVPKYPFDEKSALVLVMAWHWIGDKPILEPMTKM